MNNARGHLIGFTVSHEPGTFTTNGELRYDTPITLAIATTYGEGQRIQHALGGECLVLDAASAKSYRATFRGEGAAAERAPRVNINMEGAYIPQYPLLAAALRGKATVPPARTEFSYDELARYAAELREALQDAREIIRWLDGAAGMYADPERRRARVDPVVGRVDAALKLEVSA